MTVRARDIRPGHHVWTRSGWRLVTLATTIAGITTLSTTSNTLHVQADADVPTLQEENMSKKTDAERDEAIAELRKLLKVGDVVYTDLRHVSRSGMSRVISVHIGRKGEIQDITWLAARATGMTLDTDRWGLKVGGCGMDMGFHVVYNLSRTLWPKGHRCTGRTRRGRQVCRSNDHVNIHDLPYDGRTVKHRDGGYALQHAWL